jgi:hypothetical protein
MKNAVKVLAAIAVVAVLGAGVAGHGMAQSNDVLGCRNTEFDYNADGRLTKSDMNHFVTLATADGCWLGSAEGTGCGVYDLDGNRLVNEEDLVIPHSAFIQCIGQLSPSAVGELK